MGLSRLWEASAPDPLTFTLMFETRMKCYAIFLHTILLMSFEV